MTRRLLAVRPAVALLRLGWRSAPGLMTAAALLATVGALASVGYTVGFRTVIDAAAHHDLAEDRRLLDDLFALATAQGSARELRTYGIAAAVAERTEAPDRPGRGPGLPHPKGLQSRDAPPLSCAERMA